MFSSLTLILPLVVLFFSHPPHHSLPCPLTPAPPPPPSFLCAGHVHTGNILLQGDTCKLVDIENTLLGLPSIYRQFLVELKKLRVCVCVCVCVCLHLVSACMCVRASVCACVHVCACNHVCVHASVHASVCVRASMCVCACIHVYVCIRVCMYVCVCRVVVFSGQGANRGRYTKGGH